MTTLREAAQQALKSLRGYRREIGCGQPCDAEAALEAALEQPEQERSFPLYTHPPRREWRSLNEEEIWRAIKSCGTAYGLEVNSIARAIEAALRSKNHE